MQGIATMQMRFNLFGGCNRLHLKASWSPIILLTPCLTLLVQWQIGLLSGVHGSQRSKIPASEEADGAPV